MRVLLLILGVLACHQALSKEVLYKYDFVDVQERLLETSNCTQCHTHFSNYDVVRGLQQTIVSYLAEDRMPFPKKKGQKVTPVGDEVKEMFSQWVADGMPQRKTERPKPIEPIVLKPNWISVRDTILGPKCIACHNGFGPRAPTNMATYEALSNWWADYPELFDLKDAENSHFIGAIRGRVDDDEFFFDPMPLVTEFDDVEKEFEPVTEKEIDVLKEWIALGLPEKEMEKEQ